MVVRLPLVQVASAAGVVEWRLPNGVLTGDLILVGVTGYEPPMIRGGDQNLPDTLFGLGTEGRMNTNDGPKPLTWLGYQWVGHDVDDAHPYYFTVTREYALGGIPFLQRSTVMIVLRNVDRIVFEAPAGGTDEYDPEGHGYANPWSTGAAAVELDAAVMLIATSNGTVAGHAGADQTGQWNLRRFDQGGRKAVSIYTWVSPGDGIDNQAKVLRPNGVFPLLGTRPSAYMIGTGLARKIRSDPPVVRQYPRDSKGLAASRRLYPPPRGNRLVGGHQ